MDLSIVEAALRVNARVILPGLGAFLRQDNAVVLDVATLTFSPALQQNDGVLDGYIAQSKGLSQADAQAYVQQLVAQVESELSMVGSCTFPGLGTLRRVAGIFSFAPEGGSTNPWASVGSAPAAEIDLGASPSVGFEAGSWNTSTFGTNSGTGTATSGMGYTPLSSDPEPVLSFDFSPSDSSPFTFGTDAPSSTPASDSSPFSFGTQPAGDSGFGSGFGTPPAGDSSNPFVAFSSLTSTFPNADGTTPSSNFGTQPTGDSGFGSGFGTPPAGDSANPFATFGAMASTPSSTGSDASSFNFGTQPASDGGFGSGFGAPAAETTTDPFAAFSTNNYSTPSAGSDTSSFNFGSQPASDSSFGSGFGTPAAETTTDPFAAFSTNNYSTPSAGSDASSFNFGTQPASDSGFGSGFGTPAAETTTDPFAAFSTNDYSTPSTGSDASSYSFGTQPMGDSSFGSSYGTPTAETTTDPFAAFSSNDYSSPSSGSYDSSYAASTQETSSAYGESYSTPVEETSPYAPSAANGWGTNTAPAEPASSEEEQAPASAESSVTVEEGSRYTNCSVPPVSVASQDGDDFEVKEPRRKSAAKRVVLTLLVLILLGCGGFWAYCHWMDPALELRLQGQLAQLLHRNPLQAKLPPSTAVMPDTAKAPATESAPASDLQRDYQARTQGGDSVPAPAATSEPAKTPEPAAATAVPEPVPTPQSAGDGTLSVDASMPYHIVLGSFRNSEYAEQFSQMVAEEGFKSVIIEQSSGMSAVAVASFSSRSAAASALAALQPQYPQAWILEQ